MINKYRYEPCSVSSSKNSLSQNILNHPYPASQISLDERKMVWRNSARPFMTEPGINHSVVKDYIPYSEDWERITKPAWIITTTLLRMRSITRLAFTWAGRPGCWPRPWERNKKEGDGNEGCISCGYWEAIILNKLYPTEDIGNRTWS